MSLEDLYKGRTAKLAVQRDILCNECEGVGGKKGTVQPCKQCDGRGVEVKLRQVGPGMVQQFQMKCSKCDGMGELFDEKFRCKACKGKKTVVDRKVLEVHIEPGMVDGQKIVFAGESNQVPGIPTGDVIIVLEERDHPRFKRAGMDLMMDAEISLVEALTGFQRVVTHLDGRQILINHPPGTVISDGEVKAIPNEGMPRHKDPFEKGYLLVKFHVVFPTDNFANPEQLKQLEALLGPKPALPAVGDEVEHHDLQPFSGEDARARAQANRQAYDDDDDQHHHGGPGVQCASQ